MILVQNVHGIVNLATVSWCSYSALSREPAISGCRSVALNSKPEGAGDVQSWPLKYEVFCTDCESEEAPEVSLSGQALCWFGLLQRTAPWSPVEGEP